MGAIFSRLPPGDQMFTVSALSKAWRDWAAPRRAQAYTEGVDGEPPEPPEPPPLP
jgi:hypothetical protein